MKDAGGVAKMLAIRCFGDQLDCEETAFTVRAPTGMLEDGCVQSGEGKGADGETPQVAGEAADGDEQRGQGSTHGSVHGVLPEKKRPKYDETALVPPKRKTQ